MIRNNFTLLELSVVLLIIVSLASFVLSQGLPVIQQSTERNLDQKMQLIEEAIVGSPSIRDFDGSIIPNGYVNDIGSFPNPNDPILLYTYQELLEQSPSSLPNYFNHDLTISGKLYAGWNGPYLTEAGYSKLKNIIKLEFIDDDDDGNEDLRIFVNGYSDLDRYIYWKDNFKKKNISISGVPSSFTSKVTIDYIENGVIRSYEQEIKGSAETTIDLPKGLCAFYAEFIPTNTVVAVQANPIPVPDDLGEKVRVAESGTSSFKGKENNIATWNGSNYSFSSPTVMDTLHDESDNKYYLYSLDEGGITLSWKEQIVKGTKTPRVIKTMKTEILLELE